VRAAVGHDLLTTNGRSNDPLRWSLLSSLGYLDIDRDRSAAEAGLQQAVDQLALEPHFKRQVQGAERDLARGNGCVKNRQRVGTG
jgi:hypothetical protein